MREIKFRVWGPHSKYMWSWEEIGWQMSVGSLFGADSGDKIVMQYTGLKDKNDVEIYEGDIVKDDEGLPLEVNYRDGAFWAEALLLAAEPDVEIIGNIHENPELLEATK